MKTVGMPVAVQADIRACSREMTGLSMKALSGPLMSFLVVFLELRPMGTGALGVRKNLRSGKSSRPSSDRRVISIGAVTVVSGTVRGEAAREGGVSRSEGGMLLLVVELALVVAVVVDESREEVVVGKVGDER
jgi:hypothetical protein